MATSKPLSIDEYIAGFPAETQHALQEIRDTIHQAAPDAEETISYDMPTFNLNGSYLIYFAGWKKHVAIYPVTEQMFEALSPELTGYKGSKSSVHFPLNKPMPLDLVRKITELRIAASKSPQSAHREPGR